MKKTRWFEGVEPVRKGVYERKYGWGTGLAYFDGADWGLASETVEEARRWRPTSSMRTYGGKPWRGLVSKGGGA